MVPKQRSGVGVEEGMFRGIFQEIPRRLRRLSPVAGLFVTGLLCLASGAQQAGPMKPPPAAPPTSDNGAASQMPQMKTQVPTEGSPPPAVHGTSSSPISTAPPSIPVDQIIQKFAAREAEFKKERDNYTYTQNFLVETVDESDRPDGEYRLTSEIVFTPEGRRYEHVTYALSRIMLSPEDMQDLQNIQPFVLTTEELPKYDVKYVGRQQVDEISAYVLDVGPKKIEKGQRYFQGRIWVEDKDLEIVKTYGKAVPDIKKGGNENVFPMFETFRENIEGNYWFPTYTRADDVLHFSSGAIHIRMSVRYSNYKRFGVTIKIRAAQDH
jgi:hypothetical protein